MSASTGSTSDSVHIDLIAGHRDPRGVVFEPLAADEIGEFRNVHVVVSEPGAIRANHRHLRGTKVTSELGPVLVRRDRRGPRCECAGRRDVAISFSARCRACVPQHRFGPQRFGVV